MSGDAAVWLTEEDVADLVDLPAAVVAVADALGAEARGEAATMVKTHAAWPGGTLHAVGGVLAGAAGTKTWAHTTGGAEPLLVLFDAAGGRVLAVIEAFALGQLRTAAVSAVATDRLAAAGPLVLAVLGTGKQALPQVAAVAAVRPVTAVRVWSPDPAHRDAFAGRVTAELGLPAGAEGSPERAVAGAGVITLATRARRPFLPAPAVPAGAHINAIGAITPERAEFEAALLARCAVVAADSVDAARELSSELREWYGADGHGWSGVIRLGDLVAARTSRPAGADVTLFKAMGVGIADVAVGLACLQRAREAGRGRPLEPRRRAAPRLHAGRAPAAEDRRGRSRP